MQGHPGYKRPTPELYPLETPWSDKVLIALYDSPPLCRACRPTPRRPFAAQLIGYAVRGQSGGSFAEARSAGLRAARKARRLTAGTGSAGCAGPGAPYGSPRQASARPPTKRGRGEHQRTHDATSHYPEPNAGSRAGGGRQGNPHGRLRRP